MLYDLVIIGGGPGGIAAGIYAARKKIKSAIVAGDFGGASKVSADIQNWIGTKSISGYDWAKGMEEHLRAQEGITIPVSLTQYCVQGETRRGRQTRHGIVAADPRIFPLSRYVEVFLGSEYLGRYLVDDTGGNVLGATLDIWNPDCKEAARFGRHWGAATLVAREVEQVPNDTLVPTRWDGIAKR